MGDCAGEPAFARFVRSRGPRRLLLVMRHGKAEPFAAEDHQRRLTERGSADAVAAGEWLATQRNRAHARLRLVGRARRGDLGGAGRGLRLGRRAAVEDTAYTADPDTAVDLLRAAPAEARR